MKLIFTISVLTFILGITSLRSQEIENKNEEFYYNLKMSFVKIGEGIIKVKNDTTPGMSYIMADIQTTGIIKVLYNAGYFYSADMDKNTGFPFKANKILNEGKFHTENELLFDRTTRPDSCIIHSQLSGIKIFPMEVYDILTGYFKYRADILNTTQEPGQKWMVKCCFADKEWDLKITYAGRENIKTIWGDTPCIKCFVSTLAGPIFKNENDMMMWITDDLNHVPVKFKANLKIGSFICDLTDYRIQ
ncbi:MAG: DUF3108 domain-containing protein [Prolixibacteraceae bacterium]|nr:DUF3108 domain-containing protein [Prolixibacteraceae bacterium]MBN2772811.1 DUF3108 domain-containing protein [Prolixibacteraceae bacterium]